MSGKSNRGFASMDPERLQEIASLGGTTSHAKGTAREFTLEEARAAGRKGGKIVSADREHMAQIGKKGGYVSGERRRIARIRKLISERRVSPPEES